MTKERKNHVRIFGVAVLVLLLCLSIVFAIISQVAFAATSSDTDVDPNLRFTLINDGTEYKVRAKSKTITSAVIPETYKGLPVTEIADSGFSSCTKLTNIVIPDSIRHVGEYAFYNCPNWEEYDGMRCVEVFSDYAFASCPLMPDLLITDTAEFVGTGIVLDNSNNVFVRTTEEEMDNIAAVDWAGTTGQIFYGNELLCTEIYSQDDSNKVIGYSINSRQSLNAELTSPDVCIRCVFKKTDDDGNVVEEFPIINISRDAFWGTECNSITLDYDPDFGNDYTVNLESYALAHIKTNSINIEVNVTYNDTKSSNGKSTNIFTSSTMSTVTMPDVFSEILPNMFSNCNKLTTIKYTNENVTDNNLSSQITYIGDGAFQDCAALTTTPKNKASYRQIVMPQNLLNLLKEYKTLCQQEYDFQENNFIFGGKVPLSDQTLRRQFNMYAKKAGVKRIRIHDLRHSHASLLINKGQNILIVSKRLGHGDITQTLNTYSHLFPNAQKQIIDAIEIEL